MDLKGQAWFRAVPADELVDCMAVSFLGNSQQVGSLGPRSWTAPNPGVEALFLVWTVCPISVDVPYGRPPMPPGTSVVDLENSRVTRTPFGAKISVGDYTTGWTS